MNLTTADKVSAQIELMKRAEALRSPQRALLNRFFNGEPPWSAEDAKSAQILINFNDKQGMNLLHQARNQCETAFSRRDNFFRVFLPDCKSDFATDWADTITRHLNDALRGSAPWYYTQDMVWGGVVLHGVGAKAWWDEDNPIPKFVGIQDILLPTDTDLTLDNLPCLAVRRKMRPGLLYRKTLGRKNPAPGWNLPLVKRLLDEYKDLNQNPNNYNWTDHPEQMAELYKQQSGGYYDSDIAPVLWLWDFWYREEGEHEGREPGWYQSIVLDRDCVPGRTGQPNDPVQFLYESKSPEYPELSRFIHFQFGDGNNVPEFMYHSIRSLAYLTYELCWTMNRMNCQFTQHIFEQLMTFIRVSDPNDRARLSKVTLSPPFAVIPDGLQIIPGNERYTPNPQLIELGLANYKQRLGEVSSTYTQQLDTGTAKERTKFEVQAVLAQTSALLSTLLGRLYRQEHFAYCEIARRFARPNSTSLIVRKFQIACQRDGVPESWMQYDRWRIEADQVLGSGNRAMEIAEATELMQNRDAFDPNAQQEIKHDWTLAITNNPKKAARLAPLAAKPQVSESTRNAQELFGTLMLGIDLEPQEGMNHLDQITALLGCMAQVIQRIESTDQLGTQQDLRGLEATGAFIAKHLLLLQRDPKMAPLVKQFTGDLSKLFNLIKGYQQRQQEAQGQQSNQQPEALAKAQATLLQTAAKIKGKEAADQQKLAQKDKQFAQKMAQTNASFVADQQRKNAELVTTQKRENIVALADQQRQNLSEPTEQE